MCETTPRKLRFTLPLTFKVVTFSTVTLKSFSTASLISRLVASLATLKAYWLLASPKLVAFSVMCGSMSTV